ncbi:MAG TPA: YbaK/EbsC family protein [Dehalococcoidia bacterium]|nr:YbaK/EbsC family protein [Dehalococcoidia bacterium]
MPAKPTDNPSTQKVLDAARRLGLAIEVRHFTEGTRTAREAAQAVGASLGQIAKSMVFLADGKPVLVLTSGPNRVDAAKVALHLGADQVRRASADEVRQATGFAIGGVPPFGHTQALIVLFDRDLLRFETVWGAAGTPNAVFAVEPRRLAEASGAVVADIKE